jgi:allantoinase
MKLRPIDRDFAGYRARYPQVRWPSGAHLAVSVVINVEEGAELALGMGDERNEAVHEIVLELEGVRDFCMESHFEYGTRAAWRRIIDLLGRYGVTATVSANGRAVAYSPWLASDAVAAGHEVACHGWRWESHAHFDEDYERKIIRRTYDVLADAAGVAPCGWHTKSSPSANTRRLLVEHGGFLYDSDAYNDDLPFLVDVGGSSHIVLPYAFDTNDMRFHRNGGFVFAQDFARYCIDAFDWLYEEGQTAPRMIIGRPGRIAGLDTFLRHATAKSGVWFATRRSIAEHWRSSLESVPVNRT